jgi:hypothetical protein
LRALEHQLVYAGQALEQAMQRLRDFEHHFGTHGGDLRCVTAKLQGVTQALFRMQ